MFNPFRPGSSTPSDREPPRVEASEVQPYITEFDKLKQGLKNVNNLNYVKTKFESISISPLLYIWVMTLLNIYIYIDKYDLSIYLSIYLCIYLSSLSIYMYI